MSVTPIEAVDKTSGIPGKKEAIRALTAAKYILFPLSGRSKIPCKDFLWRTVKHGQYGEKELMGSNYAIALGPDDFVLDADPRNFGSVLPDGQIISRKKNPDGTLVPRAANETPDNPLKRLADAVGSAFDTFTVKTGSGGYHFIFKIKVPEDRAIGANLNKLGYYGLDTKHHGGYIVAAGSVHPETGQPYQIFRKTPAQVIQAPEKLVALVTRPAQEDLSAGTGTFKDDDLGKTRYIHYLEKKAPLAIQGSGGNATAYTVAVRGRDFALSPEITLELLLEHWDARCVPPWGEIELRGIVKHAYRYATSPIGNAHPDAGLVDFQNDPLPNDVPFPPATP